MCCCKLLHKVAQLQPLTRTIHSRKTQRCSSFFAARWKTEVKKEIAFENTNRMFLEYRKSGS